MFSLKQSRTRFLLAAIALIALQLLAVAALPKENGRVLASNLLQVASSLTAMWACWLAFRRSSPFARRFWPFLGCSFGAWSVAQTLWLVNEALEGVVVGPTNATLILFFFSFTPFVLILFLNQEESRTQDWERTLDFLQIGIVIFCAYLYVFYLPTRWESQQETSNRMLDHVFVVRNLVLVVLLWLRAALGRSNRERSLFSLAAGFVTTYAVLTRVPTYARLHWSIGTGSWMDIFWSLPFLIFAVLIAFWEEPKESPERRPRGLRALLAMHFAPTLIPLMVLALAAQIAREQLVVALLPSSCRSRFIVCAWS